jgi:quercetin dioxygenase-like cupin family protein
MIVHSVPAVAAAAVAGNPSRPATALIHDSADARVVVFRIDPGQQVPVHTSASTVLLTVITGSGVVTGAGADHEVGAGDVIAYAAGEPHGMRALAEPLVIAAVIAPRPGAH